MKDHMNGGWEGEGGNALPCCSSVREKVADHHLGQREEDKKQGIITSTSERCQSN